MYKRRSRPKLILADRRINLRFVGAEVAVILVLAVVLAVVHGFQEPRNAAFLRAMADEAVEQGRHDDAIRYLRLYLGSRPSDHEVFAQLAALLAQQNTVDADYEAYEKLLQVLRRDPGRHEFRVELIRLALEIGENGQALAQAKTLEPVAAENPRWWLPIARAYTINQNLDAAIKAYEKFVEEFPNDLAAYREYLGLVYEQSQNKELLKSKIDEMLARNSERADAYLLAYVLRRDYQISGAVEALDVARRLSPADADVLLMAAGESMRRHSPRTEEILEEALKLHPKDTRVLLLFGRFLQGQGNATRALELFQRGFEIESPTRAEFAWRIADLLLLLQRSEEASPYLTALRADPIYRSADEYVRGRFALAQGELEEASEHFNRANRILESPYERAALGDTSSELQYALELAQSSVAYLEGRLADAIDLAKQAENRLPESALPKMTLASLYFEAGRYESAVGYWQQALQHPPVPDMAYFSLARSILYSLSRNLSGTTDFSPFQDAYDTALRRIPNAADLVALRAEYLLIVHEYDDAIQTLTAGVQGHPQDLQLPLSLLGAYLWSERYDQGLQYVRRLRRTVGVSAPIAILHAQLLNRSGDLNKAAEILERAEKVLPDVQKPAVRSARGLQFWLLGRQEKAKETFIQIAQENPGDEYAQVLLLTFHLENGDWSAAEELAQRWRKERQTRHLARWATVMLLARRNGLRKEFSKPIESEHRALVQERPYWWGTSEVAGVVADIAGDGNRAARSYALAAWTGPAFPFILERLTSLLPADSKQVDLLIKTVLQRRIQMPADKQFLQRVQSQQPLSKREDVPKP